jgi:hypothetical protein
MACHAYIDGDDPLAGVDMEGRISYGDMDDVMAAYYKGH